MATLVARRSSVLHRQHTRTGHSTDRERGLQLNSRQWRRLQLNIRRQGSEYAPGFMEYEYGKFITDSMRQYFGLRSVYADASEVPIMNHVPQFKEAINYIFHNTSALLVNEVLGEVDPDYLSKVVGLPNAHSHQSMLGF